MLSRDLAAFWSNGVVDGEGPNKGWLLLDVRPPAVCCLSLRVVILSPGPEAFPPGLNDSPPRPHLEVLCIRGGLAA